MDYRALSDAVGFKVRIDLLPYKCDRNYYKKILREVFRNQGINAPLGGQEYGEDIARNINRYNASKSDPGFKSFSDSIRSWIKRNINIR